MNVAGIFRCTCLQKPKNQEKCSSLVTFPFRPLISTKTVFLFIVVYIRNVCTRLFWVPFPQSLYVGLSYCLTIYKMVCEFSRNI